MYKSNLLFIITKLELGGAQTQLLTLLKHLDRSRFNLFLFAAKEGVLVEEAASLDGLIFHRSKYLERPIHPVRDLLAFIEIVRFIKKNKIDMVHTHSSKAGILGRWAAAFAKTRTVIHTVHGWSFNDFQSSLKRNFFIWLEMVVAKRTSRIVVVSAHDKKKGLDHRIGVEKQYQLIRYGIDKVLFSSKSLAVREEFGIGPADLVVGTVACFKPQKAPEDFLRLACRIRSILPRVRFLMVGDGALRDRIRRSISEYDLGSQMILTGWRRDIPQVLSCMDVFILTSLWEGLPIAVLEAMAAAVPVVATHTGGIAEIVSEGKTGFLVPCHDVASMLKKLTLLLKDGALRDQMGQKARESVGDEFSVKAMVQATEMLYIQALNEREKAYVH